MFRSKNIKWLFVVLSVIVFTITAYLVIPTQFGAQSQVVAVAEEAGSPIISNQYYPLKEVAAIDNTPQSSQAVDDPGTITDPSTIIGYGIITGYAVTNVAYTLNVDPTKLETVTFTLDSAATTVKARLVSGSDTWFNCTVISGFNWSCSIGGAVTVLAANSLEVVAVQ